MNEKIFDINYKRAVLLLLPTFLRREVLTSFLYAMVAPAVTLYDLFTVNRKNNLYRLRMNGQVCYLRKVLNDAFPDAGRAIRVEDEHITGRWAFFWDLDNAAGRVTLAYDLNTDQATKLWDRDAIMDKVNSFVVVCPKKLQNYNNEVRLKSILNTYKLLSKSYRIVYE
jgi:hypothetical protein